MIENVNENQCRECPYFKWVTEKETMIKNNICSKRDAKCCEMNGDEKDEREITVV